MNLLWFDYAIIAMPAILIAIWAQTRILQALAASSKRTTAAELTGAELAEAVMNAGGAMWVEIEPASGELGNYYDPDRKTLRLSREILEGRSIAAIAIAVREAGHAIQDAAGYRGLLIRNLIAPWTVLGTQVCWIVLAAGLWLGMMRLIVLAVGLFWLHLFIQLVNVPVEIDASRRGREMLLSTGAVTAEEDQEIARVSNIIAWTYVASTLFGTQGLWHLRSSH